MASIDPADYWKLRALRTEVDRLEAELRLTVAERSREIETAQARVAETFEPIAKAHALDMAATYTWNDADCTLVATEARQ